MCEVETIRENFRPRSITTLFVGESVPANGTFFYKGDSNLYKYLKEALGGDRDFLACFKASGYFLDDLVPRAVNRMAHRDRRRLRRECVPDLARRLSEYRPLAVVALMIGIEPMVREALAKASLTDIPFDATPFPANGQQRRFRSKMAEIIPKLPKGLS